MLPTNSAAQKTPTSADVEATYYDEDTDFYSDLDDYSYGDDQYSYGTDTSSSSEESSEAQGDDLPTDNTVRRLPSEPGTTRIMTQSGAIFTIRLPPRS